MCGIYHCQRNCWILHLHQEHFNYRSLNIFIRKQREMERNMHRNTNWKISIFSLSILASFLSFSPYFWNQKMSNLLSESSPIRLSVLQEQIYVKFSRSLIDGQMMISSRYRAFQLDSRGFDSTPCKFTCLWVHNDIWGCDLRRFTVKTVILVHQMSHQQTSDLKTMLKTCAHTCPSPVIINYINGVIF